VLHLATTRAIVTHRLNHLCIHTHYSCISSLTQSLISKFSTYLLSHSLSHPLAHSPTHSLVHHGRVRLLLRAQQTHKRIGLPVLIKGRLDLQDLLHVVVADAHRPEGARCSSDTCSDKLRGRSHSDNTLSNTIAAAHTDFYGTD